MKTFTPPVVKTIFFLLLILALQSCQTDVPGTYKNEKISSGKRSDLHSLNDQLFKAMKEGNKVAVNNLLSQEMLDDTYTVRLTDLVSYRYNSAKYRVLDEFYIVNKYEGNDTIKVTNEGINNYTLKFKTTAAEMYIAFLIPENVPEQWMITLVYSKLKYGWKITSMEQAKYAVNGKNTPELFKLAQQQYAKKYFVDMMNSLTLANDCDKPNDMWQYNSDNDRQFFYNRGLAAVNSAYKWPMVFEQLPTKPKIIRLVTQNMNQGNFPMIHYLSSVDIHDGKAIMKEHEGVKRVIGQMLPGIDKDKKYLQYQVYNKNVPIHATLRHYDIVDTLMK